MSSYRTASFAAAALLSVSSISVPAEAAEMAGVMMKDGKMMLMNEGKATAPMDFEITLTDGSKVTPDGTLKMKDGMAMRIKEGQMVTMDGKLIDGAMAMDGDKPMKMNWIVK